MAVKSGSNGAAIRQNWTEIRWKIIAVGARVAGVTLARTLYFLATRLGSRKTLYGRWHSKVGQTEAVMLRTKAVVKYVQGKGKAENDLMLCHEDRPRPTPDLINVQFARKTKLSPTCQSPDAHVVSPQAMQS